MGMEYTCFTLALLALVGSIALAMTKKARKNLAHQLRAVGVGTIAAMAILFFPFSVNHGATDPILSLLVAVQAAMLGAGYESLLPDMLQTNAYTWGTFAHSYRLALEVLMVVSPIFVGGILVTISDILRDKLTYQLRRRWRQVFYFSELNQRAMTLAKSLMEETGEKNLVVFCNFDADEASAQLTAEAKDMGFLMLGDGEWDKVNHRTKQSTFFEISQDDDVNLDRTKKLIDTFHGDETEGNQRTIYLFTQQIEAEIVMNSLDDKKGILVQIIDKPVRLAYELMFQSPLYQALERTRTQKISALVIGADNLGKEVIKAMAWSGQLGAEYALDIQVVDVNAQQVEKKFRFQYPQLVDYSGEIAFHAADVTTTDFEGVLEAHCQDTNYIVITLGDRSEAMQTALYLRKYYLQKGKNHKNSPIIHVFVPNAIKSSYAAHLKLGSQMQEQYDIHPFGSDNEFYSKANIVDGEIELLARNAEGFYSGAYSDQTQERLYRQEILSSYNKNEINKRSNRANVIHIKTKLFAMGYQMKLASQLTAEERGRVLSATEFRAVIQAQDEPLARLEHQRWNAFQTSEGYQGVSIAQAERYRGDTHSHKHVMAKLHPCICTWEELDQVSCALGQGNTDFKAYDYGFVRAIPKIIGVEQDWRINISDTHYAILPLCGAGIAEQPGD